jgi:hypothetical protein
MAGKCFACGKPIDLDVEAICSEKCLQRYEKDVEALRKSAQHPRTVSECIELLERVRQMPIVELARA